MKWPERAMTSVSPLVRDLNPARRGFGSSRMTGGPPTAASGGAGEDIAAALRDVALHNLRTPLSVAEGAIGLLRDHGDRGAAGGPVRVDRDGTPSDPADGRRGPGRPLRVGDER